ncbi:MAG: YebC/PmpR family DNA-binding transcriptional regulator [Candidatus Daviesbacteria bacterium]|nr:YebC/PmpR family DNA-binding transcriptional regulator [Candidatus Daviesbacteria bacterium]
MSGHSKWSTIKRAKGTADIKKGMVFTKLANAIALAARAGNSGDVNSNPRLRTVLEDAKKVNMPKENVQRAIDRGLGKLPGQTIEEVTYEGFGPGKVAFYLEGVTDNKLRTNSEIKNLFEKSGGNLGSLGSVAYMFDKKGEIRIKSQVTSGKSQDEEMLELIDLGAGDVEEYLEDEVQKYLVYTEITQLNNVSTKITQSGFEVESAEIIMKPNIIVNISDKEIAEKVMEFTEKLEEHDDIQKVFANFEIDEELMSSL